MFGARLQNAVMQSLSKHPRANLPSCRFRCTRAPWQTPKRARLSWQRVPRSGSSCSDQAMTGSKRCLTGAIQVCASKVPARPSLPALPWVPSCESEVDNHIRCNIGWQRWLGEAGEPPVEHAPPMDAGRWWRGRCYPTLEFWPTTPGAAMRGR